MRIATRQIVLGVKFLNRFHNPITVVLYYACPRLAAQPSTPDSFCASKIGLPVRRCNLNALNSTGLQRQRCAGFSVVQRVMFAIEMYLRAFTQDLLKIIQAANIDGVALRVHPGSAADMNTANLTETVRRLF